MDKGASGWTEIKMEIESVDEIYEKNMKLKKMQNYVHQAEPLHSLPELLLHYSVRFYDNATFRRYEQFLFARIKLKRYFPLFDSSLIYAKNLQQQVLLSLKLFPSRFL